VVATVVVATAEGGVLGESNRQLAAASDKNTKLVNALAEPRQKRKTFQNWLVSHHTGWSHMSRNQATRARPPSLPKGGTDDTGVAAAGRS
jgi:hypothetical protein